MWTFEKEAVSKGFVSVAGVDEAGRGPLAGPVVSAAVILPLGMDIPGVADSKTISEKKREQVFALIRAHALGVGIGVVDAAEIDAINILQASLKSMRLAVDNLPTVPDYLLADGKFFPDVSMAGNAVVKGDSRSVSIAAASIIAKVTRDRMMQEYDAKYPGYGFAKHKGYPTKAHKLAIRVLGPCAIHRKTFRGVGASP